MRKLRQMEMTTGIWTMQVTMQVESRDLVIVDRQTEVSREGGTISNLIILTLSLLYRP